MWAVGVASGLVVVAFDWILQRGVSEEQLDDGGLNRLLFQNLSYVEILSGHSLGGDRGRDAVSGSASALVGHDWYQSAFYPDPFPVPETMDSVGGGLFGISCLLAGLTEWTGSLTPPWWHISPWTSSWVCPSEWGGMLDGHRFRGDMIY